MNDKAFHLSPALDGDRLVFDGPVGQVSYYLANLEAATQDKPPLLLIHSVNAAASAYEVRPLFEHYRAAGRCVAAIDLPGYGFSARPDKLYTPRIMTDAILAWIAEIQNQTGTAQVDALGASLSCEFLARAAVEQPALFRSLALVSPTGFEKSKSRAASRGETRGKAWLHSALTGSSLVAKQMFVALSSRPSIRFFLRKTWGSKNIDQGAVDYAYETAHQPGARHAPYSFLSGHLFSADVVPLYERIDQPIWLGYGRESSYTDSRATNVIKKNPHSRTRAFDAGALPYFQVLAQFTESYNEFLAAVSEPGTS